MATSITHDFTRDIADDNRVAPLSIEEITQCRSKFLHKMSRFRDACRTDGKKLFIRLGGEFREPIAWPYIGDPEPLAFSRINHLVRTLERYCRSSDFVLAHVRYPSLVSVAADEQLDQKVKLLTLPDSVGRTSVGDFGSLGVLAVITRLENQSFRVASKFVKHHEGFNLSLNKLTTSGA